MYVYIITNLINNKKYIGVSVNKKYHFRETYYGSGKILKQAIKKYGKHNFKKEIIKEFKSEQAARNYERYLIKKLNAVEDKNYYNLVAGGFGGGVRGRKVSKSTRLKISKSLTGKKRPKSVIEKMIKNRKNRIITECEKLKRGRAIKIAWSKMSKSDKIARNTKISEAKLGVALKTSTKIKLSKYNATLSELDVFELFTLRYMGATFSTLSYIFNINPSSIFDILHKRSYKWIWS